MHFKHHDQQAYKYVTIIHPQIRKVQYNTKCKKVIIIRANLQILLPDQDNPIITKYVYFKLFFYLFSCAYVVDFQVWCKKVKTCNTIYLIKKSTVITSEKGLLIKIFDEFFVNIIPNLGINAYNVN